MSTEITEKISRLLALAASPYEAEARAALLKARQLMAEHKLCPEDITPPERQRVIKESTGVTSTKMSSPWAVQLSAIIGEHYCCRHYILNIKGRKIHEIGFVGFEDDYKVCKMVYRYAFESIMSPLCRYQEAAGLLCGGTPPDVQFVWLGVLPGAPGRVRGAVGTASGMGACHGDPQTGAGRRGRNEEGDLCQAFHKQLA